MSTTTTSLPATGTYTVDPAHSQIGFKVRHLVVSKVRGSFGRFDATLTVADEPLASAVDVTVQLASIDTGDDARDGHLRSADFFDVEQHPTMTYRSTAVREVGDGRFEVDGELTVLGVTKPLTLQATFEGAAKDPWGNTKVAFSATGKVNREAYGITWNQALESGGVLVGKDIEVEIDAQFVQA